MSTKLYSYLISGSEDTRTIRVVRKKAVIIMCFAILTSIFPGRIVSAAPVSSDQAETVVRSFMQRDRKPLGAVLGIDVLRSETFDDVKGESLYHVVYMAPSGFFIVPADDLVEPIIAFSSGGEYDPSPANPFGALVSRDLPGRIEHVRGLQHAALKAGITLHAQGRVRDAQQRWIDLSKELDQNTTDSLPGISDIRVAPLIQSKWSQETVSGNACYNYYTPPYTAGSSANYPCGCVATAMAQLMRFHQHPTSGVGTDSFLIEVNGTPEWRNLRGGDGSGDSYNWSDMVLDPSLGSTLTERQAIGALCHDAGITVEMSYSATGSGIYDFVYISDALLDVFYFANAVAGWNNNNNFSATSLWGMLNPNLDAELPTLLAIDGPDAGHAVACDGYGYSGTTMYHHLNMGWAGSADVWYNLPDIDSSPSFDTVWQNVYNMFVSGSGEIISGRVVDDLDQPIEGASVVGDRVGGGQYTVVTDSNGIYALAKIPSASSYTINVTKSGYTFIEKTSSTGTSSNDEPSSGNVWGVNFTDGEVPQEIICSFPMDSDPGWATEGLWAFGLPLGGGSHNGDPSSGYTGSKVYGYNLAGDYTNNIPQYWLTTTPLNCSAYSGVTLKFQRWLGVESASYDHAEIEASNDGSTWTTVWSHTSSSFSDTSWQEMSYDISSVADGQPIVYIRWGMGPTDDSVTYPGWNIDDVVLEGNRSAVDSDGDGMPDAWELQHFGDPTNCVATDNPDHDAHNNLQECITGMDPNRGDSCFSVTNCTPLSGSVHFVIEWNSVSGRVYSALWSSNLTNSFQPLETGIEYPRNSYTDTLHSAEDKCFYEVEVKLKQESAGDLAGTTWIEDGYPTSSIIFNSNGTTLRIVDTSDGTDATGTYTQTGDTFTFSANFTDDGDFIEIWGEGSISGITMPLSFTIEVNGEFFDSGTTSFTKQ